VWQLRGGLVTQVGEGRGAGYGASAAAGGELLAERYQLLEHVNSDSAGRQIWRGVDVVLRRPVALVVRYPGGPAAAQMLQTAVEASRIVHPHLVGVYDAIDEHSRAYVVREWVDGASLRDHLAGGLLDAHWAVEVARACADGVTAVHTAGMTHGNVHPGTILIDSDGRVVLADAHADGAAPYEEDVRAVGAVLYFALTGYWPHAEVAGPTSLPDAVRDNTGALAAPRQVRAGVPDHLDNLIMDLLDRRLPVPPADVLAAELGRLAGAPEVPYYPPEAGFHPYQPAGYVAAGAETGSGPIRFTSPAEEPKAMPSGRKLALGLSGLLAAALIGVLVGITWLTGGPTPGANPGTPPSTGPGATGAPEAPDATPAPIPLTADQVRVVDPPQGNRAELDGIELVLDDDLSTSWQTDTYNSAAFGGIKPGMGILLDLGEPTQVASVRLELATAGATAQLRVGETDPGSSSAGDDQVYQTYRPLGDPQQGGTTMVFNVDSDTSYQYLMVWFTDLPSAGGGFRVEVQQVVVEGY
jgi:hypothetical protein